MSALAAMAGAHRQRIAALDAEILDLKAELLLAIRLASTLNAELEPMRKAMASMKRTVRHLEGSDNHHLSEVTGPAVMPYNSNYRA